MHSYTQELVVASEQLEHTLAPLLDMDKDTKIESKLSEEDKYLKNNSNTSHLPLTTPCSICKAWSTDIMDPHAR